MQSASVEMRRDCVDTVSALSVRRQCELLEIPRSGMYYEPIGESDYNLNLMRLIDEQFTRTPFYGTRKITAWLNREGHQVNRKRVGRLMRQMGLVAIYPKRRLSKPCPEHKKYPYLLSSVEIVRPNQVWSTDITYVRLRRGFVYLVAVIDWFSRYVLSWELSNTLDEGFCIDALSAALATASPEIFNTDQGAQFTSGSFTKRVLDAGVRLSMDGRGRAIDNIFVERLWRTVKYEEVYLKEYLSPADAYANLEAYFLFYNNVRLHQSLDYKTPKEVHFAIGDAKVVTDNSFAN